MSVVTCNLDEKLPQVVTPVAVDGLMRVISNRYEKGKKTRVATVTQRAGVE